MDKLQYDSFYKFLVSLGIVLITLPILVLLYILNADYILISQSDYNNLSAISLQSIQTHEHILHLIHMIVPIISIPLIVIGIILITIGSYKWYGIQKELDQQIKSDTITKKINATQLNASESTAKAYRELTSEQESDSQVSTEKVVKYMAVEDKCFNHFLPKLSRKYHLKQNLLIGNVEYDIVGISRRNYTDLIFEIKYWIILPTDARLHQLFSHINCLGENYKRTTDHDFEYVIVVVTPKSQKERIQGKVEAFYSNNVHNISEKINFEFFAEEEL